MGQRFFLWWLDMTRRRASAVLVITALVALAGVWLVAGVTFDSNILRLLPRQAPAVKSFQTFLQAFGSLDHLYLVFEAQDGIANHGDLVDAYVTALRQAPEIESVDAELFEPGKDWSYLLDRSMMLVGPDGAADALARATPPRIDRELAHARDLLSTPSQQVKDLVQQDPLGWLTALRDRMDREKGMIAFDPTVTGYVSPDGKSRLVMVKPTKPALDSDFCKALFQRLDTVERTARAGIEQTEGGEPVHIEAAGAYRVSLEAEQVIRRDGIINSIGSLVILLVFVLVLFRTPWIVLYGLLPVVLGAFLALGVGGRLLGALSPATSGSAGMLFGLGIDGVVLLYLRYLEDPDRGTTPASLALMAGSAGSVALAQSTTAATFFGRLFIDFPPLQELGMLVGLGILFVCVFVLALVPAWLSRSSSLARRKPMRANWLGALVTRHSGAIVLAGIAVTIALGILASRMRVDTRIERLQTETRGAQLEQQLAERFSLPRDVLLVVNEGPDAEPLVDADARLTAAIAAREPDISAAGIGLIMPPARVQDAVASAIQASGIDADRARTEVSAAATRAGFRPEAFAPFVERLPRLLDTNARITYAGLHERGLDSFSSRFLTERNGRYYAVTYLYPRKPVDLNTLAALVKDVDPALQLTGLPVVNAELARRALPEFIKGISIGELMVTILILLVFQSIPYTLLALLPTVIGFIWAGGVLALMGTELDLFSLFAAVTFIGISVDYGIYVLYRHVVENMQDMGEVLARTGPAIVIACGTALIGFGTLVNSSYGPLQRFGVVSIVTLTCCLLASVVLLPALVIQLNRWSGSRR